MSASDIPFAILRFQYRLARMPLQLLGDMVMPRIGDQSPSRLMYERALGALDAAAGNALNDIGLQESGISRIERAAALGEVMRLGAQDQLASKREKSSTATRKVLDQSEQRGAQNRVGDLSDSEQQRQGNLS